MLDVFEEEQEQCQTPIKKFEVDPQEQNEEYLDLKLKQFKGKKDQKELELFDTGKLLQDEDKEDVHVGKGTYK